MKPNLHNVSLKITAGLPSQFPRDIRPQACFAGRSNVGKSSLINSLIMRKSLARVSSSPGKTITVNFYDIDSKLYLVDLPGYGYAKRTKEQQRVWSSLTDGYFTSNANIDCLKLTVLLIDSRVGATRDDEAMLDFLHQTGMPHIVVATKCDKLTKTQRGEFIASCEANELFSAAESIIMYSAVTGEGRDALWNAIFTHCGL